VSSMACNGSDGPCARNAYLPALSLQKTTFTQRRPVKRTGGRLEKDVVFKPCACSRGEVRRKRSMTHLRNENPRWTCIRNIKQVCRKDTVIVVSSFPFGLQSDLKTDRADTCARFRVTCLASTRSIRQSRVLRHV
jgi:hypothetical protein